MQKKDKVASHTTPPKTKPTYDWAKIKNEYVTGNYGLRELARKYGMSQSTIMKRSKREQWIAVKEQVTSKTEETVIAKTIEDRASINDIAMRALRIATEKAMAGLADVDIHDSRAIKDYMSILKDLKDIGAVSVETESKDIMVTFQDFDSEGGD